MRYITMIANRDDGATKSAVVDTDDDMRVVACCNTTADGNRIAAALNSSRKTELTDAEIQRLDDNHNCIHQMLCSLAATEVPWDMEFIAAIEDIAEEFICDRLELMTAMEFSPYVDMP